MKREKVKTPNCGKPKIKVRKRNKSLQSCDQCDFQSYWNGSLTRHVSSKHSGINYSSNKCDYKATQNNDLMRHFRAKHGEAQYQCQQCEYKVGTNDNLRRHMRKHELSLIHI